MSRSTARESPTFPTVAILRKGGPKIKRNSKETPGPDLNDRFRVDWLPGVDPSIKELFGAVYETDQPRAMIAFPVGWQAWSTINAAYQGTARFVQADNPV